MAWPNHKLVRFVHRRRGRLLLRGGDMRNCSRVILAGCILLVASSAFAQTVKVNWQSSAAFADYRTYAW
jgi:hypothetical protein